MKAFYFSTEARKLRYGDDRPIVVGETHTVSCKPKCCQQGLHASEKLSDAVGYAPGSILYLVELSGDIDSNPDKVAASSRTYLAEFDATELLMEFARKQALINIVKIKPYCTHTSYSLIMEYLTTGDICIRSAAYSAARSAADSAASAAGSAASAADSAASAAGSAASAASAAGSAASAADSAAASAAYSAAGSAAYSAYSAARSAANTMLTEMVIQAAGWESIYA